MHRDFVDHSAWRDGPFQRWDPRLKIVLALSILGAISLPALGGGKREWARLGLLGALLLAALLASRLSPPRIFVRTLVVLPFAGFVALGQLITIGLVEDGTGEGTWLRIPWTSLGFALREGGIERALALLLRAWLSIMTTLLLVATTPLPRLLLALEWFRLPRGFVQVTGLLYRYLWVLVEEGARMLLARRLRSFRRRAWLHRRAAGGIIAALFLRTLERSRRIYQAMLLRGYSGRVPVLEGLCWRGADHRRLALSLALLAAAVILPEAWSGP
ncbi:MAG: cobalt ECF transporter T component CbiQ [Planctomycetota bacterium]